MADDGSLALQSALLARLRADASLTALVSGRVYDEPPKDVAFPYVRLGAEVVGSERIGCFTDDDIAFSIECHTRPTSGRVEAGQPEIVKSGRVEAKRLAAAVRASLDDADITLGSGKHLDWLEHLTTSYSRASDGASWIAVVAFEAAVADAD